MNIEDAIHAIAHTEPIGFEEGSGNYCMYCPGEEHYDGGKYTVTHDPECAWVYFSETVKEDERVTAELIKTYPNWFLSLPALERRVK